MYAIISTISIFVRQFVLPNPFEPLGKTFVISGILLTPVILNLLVEPLLYFLAYNVTGIYYFGREPALGSFLYLFFYCVHIGLIYLMSLAHFSWWAVALVLAAYVGAHIAFNHFRYDGRY